MKILLRIVLVLFAIGLCVLFTLIGFFIGGSLSPAQNPIESVKWIPLGSPSVAVRHLYYLTPYAIYVESIDGKIYSRAFDCSTANCWVESASWDLSSPDWTDQHLVIADTCVMAQEIEKPPESIVECASITNLPMVGGYVTVYSVLLDDGSVWFWMHGAYDIDFGLSQIATLVYGTIGMCVSAILYLLLLTVFFVFWMKSKSSKLI
ncbi:MAG: hypothetical protein IT314_03625 [Anaerolineales bacterium]|nr:hypothetical protein [Anaerolineales bacterium]